MSGPRCQTCGQPVRPGARFCGSCGATQTPAGPPTTPAATVPCPHCGSAVRLGAQFCSVCGNQTGAATPYRPAPPPLPQAQPPPPPQPSYVPPPVVPVPPAAAAAAPAGDGRSQAYLLRHGLLSAVLTLGLIIALGAVYIWDKGRPEATPTPPPVPTPSSVEPTPSPVYPDPVVEIGYLRDGRFGLQTTLGDPDRSDDDGKLLTYDDGGRTNNTRVYVDGETPIYGSYYGRFVDDPGADRGVVTSAWEFGEIRVTQRLEIVAGSTTRRLDTMRIEYLLENLGSSAHEVGLRIMIDTLIGENDGVPFVVPGREGVTDRAIELTGSEVPDFIQALEQPNLVNPGVIIHMTLRGGEATPPDRVVISAWSDDEMPWDYFDRLGGTGHPLRRRGSDSGDPDSAIALYYQPAMLGAGESRRIVTFYGLGGISSTETGNTALSLTFNPQVMEGELFWIVAMIANPVEGQSLRLDLPNGLALTAGETAEKTLTFTAGDGYTQVSWLVEAQRATSDTVKVTLLPDALTEEQAITVIERVTR